MKNENQKSVVVITEKIKKVFSKTDHKISSIEEKIKAIQAVKIYQ